MLWLEIDVPHCADVLGIETAFYHGIGGTAQTLLDEVCAGLMAMDRGVSSDMRKGSREEVAGIYEKLGKDVVDHIEQQVAKYRATLYEHAKQRAVTNAAIAALRKLGKTDKEISSELGRSIVTIRKIAGSNTPARNKPVIADRSVVIKSAEQYLAGEKLKIINENLGFGDRTQVVVGALDRLSDELYDHMMAGLEYGTPGYDTALDEYFSLNRKQRLQRLKEMDWPSRSA